MDNNTQQSGLLCDIAACNCGQQHKRPQTVLGICSNKPRPSVQNSRSYQLKTGASRWGRDVWHISGSCDNKITFCGRDSSEWLVMGELIPDDNLCISCKKKAGVK